MSGVRVPHIQLRNGTYHFRLRVPDDLRLVVGAREIRRSLKTGSKIEAHRLSAGISAHLSEVFRAMRLHPRNTAEAQQAVRAIFAQMAVEQDGHRFVPSSDFPELELIEQDCLAAEAIHDLHGQTASFRVTDQSEGWAKGILTAAGVVLDPTRPELVADLVIGVLRARAEQYRLARYRLQNEGPYQAADILFSSITDELTSLRSTRGEPLGLRLGQLVEQYLLAKRRSWTDKTLRTNRAKLAVLLSHFGEDQAVGAIRPQEIRGYRDALRRLHRKVGREVHLPFAARQTEVEAAQIEPKTARLYFETCKAFFRWAKGEALIEANPAADIGFEMPKGKGGSGRRPFTSEEIEVLFSSPKFICRNQRRRQTGSKAQDDAYFWIPILGFYTGMRLGELVQLHLDDVGFGDFPHISVTDGGSDASNPKHIKSEAARRLVPLHPDLLELGFDRFVESRKRYVRTKRLFPEVKFGADGQASTTFSKWFARLLDSSGLRERGLVFHSFRHGMEDAFRNALVHQYVIDRIIGHASSKVSDGYGQGISLAVASQTVAQLIWPVSPLTVLRSRPLQSLQPLTSVRANPIALRNPPRGRR